MSRLGVIYALGPSPLDVNLIWAGTDDGRIWITRDGGGDWQEVTPPDLPELAAVYEIEISPHDEATTYVRTTIRDRILERWIKTAQTYKQTCARTVCYLSAEYLLGPHLANNLIKLGIFDASREAAHELGVDFDEILEQEDRDVRDQHHLQYQGYRPVEELDAVAQVARPVHA